MSRWLQKANFGSRTPDKSDKTDKTPAAAPKTEVLSQLSVLSNVPKVQSANCADDYAAHRAWLRNRKPDQPNIVATTPGAIEAVLDHAEAKARANELANAILAELRQAASARAMWAVVARQADDLETIAAGEPVRLDHIVNLIEHTEAQETANVD